MEFLILEIDETRFGIPTSDVREVVRAVSLGAPARDSPRMIGMLDFRGQILGVFELDYLRAHAEHQLSPLDHFIILQVEDGLFALRVDKAIDIMTWDSDHANAELPATARSPQTGLQSVSHPRLGLVHLLDTRKLWANVHADRLLPPAAKVEGVE